MKDNTKFYTVISKYNDPTKRANLRKISSSLGRLIKEKELEIKNEEYGLVKGQKVSKHVRTSKSGKKFASVWKAPIPLSAL